MSGKLAVKQAFGLNPLVKNCLVFTEEHHLAYSCGHQIAVINTESKEQAFISGTATYQHQSLGITAIVVSASKKIIAVAEKVEPAAIVTFYDTHTLKRRRVLTYNELGSNEIRCIAFTEDGRHMLVQGGAPEWNLVLWSIEKTAKVVCSVKIAQSDDTPVHQISFCPWDPTTIIVVGKSILRLFRFVEGQLRQATLTVRRELSNFISHLWLPDDNLLIGTDSGDIMFIENFEFRGYISTNSGFDEETHPVHCMAAHGRGFMIGTSNGEIKIYERNEDLKEKYSLEDSCKLSGNRGHILAFAIGPDDALVCATSRHQLVSVVLSNMAGIKDGSSGVENILTAFHGPNNRGDASITGIDVAMWKQILVTTGRDGTVRVWNTADKKMELMKQFEEEPIGLSVHPSGLYIAVAFSERIQILSLLLDEIFVVRELVARNCSEIKFSRGGQYLAAANGTNLQLYNTYTGAPVGTLRGHNNKIRSIVWMHCDSKIMTVGTEGMVYFWDLFPVNRRPEHFSGSIQISAGAGPADGSKVYIATTDRMIKELDFSSHETTKLSVKGSAMASAAAVLGSSAAGLEGAVQAAHTVETMGYVCSTMLYDDARRLLILGTCSEEFPGAVLTTSVHGQLGHPVEVNAIHSGVITAMCQSRDGSTIITGDSNGCICLSEFENVAFQKQAVKEGLVSFEFIDEVLIHRSDLEGRKGQIHALTLKVEELNQNNEHQLRLKDLEHNDNKMEIEDRFHFQLEAERVKFDELDREKQAIELSFGQKVKSLERHQADEMKTIEFKYKTKQNAEENRHRLLVEETEDAHKRWNEENRALVESHQKYLQELTIEYEEKLLAEQHKQKQLSREKESLKVKLTCNFCGLKTGVF